MCKLKVQVQMKTCYVLRTFRKGFHFSFTVLLSTRGAVGLIPDLYVHNQGYAQLSEYYQSIKCQNVDIQ